MYFFLTASQLYWRWTPFRLIPFFIYYLEDITLYVCSFILWPIESLSSCDSCSREMYWTAGPTSSPAPTPTSATTSSPVPAPTSATAYVCSYLSQNNLICVPDITLILVGKFRKVKNSGFWNIHNKGYLEHNIPS